MKKNKLNKINLLPGPVFIDDEVIKKNSRIPISHRDSRFYIEMRIAKKMLQEITHCKNVEMCMGTGTLANDIIAGQLSIINEKGIVLSNGEFGDRLIKHSRQFNLNFDVCKVKWGEIFNYRRLEDLVAKHRYSWIWFVYHETSTGMKNDFDRIQTVASNYGMKICVDCISTIGAIPVDLSVIDFASGTSGKAIGAFPGLSFIFYRKVYSSRNKYVPCYIDLNSYIKNIGVPFSFSSNLLSGLISALDILIHDKKRHVNILNQTVWIRNKLKQYNYDILIRDHELAPVITTICMPDIYNSISIGNKLKRSNIYIHYNSEYLKKRNWIQISSMSTYRTAEIDRLFNILSEFS